MEDQRLLKEFVRTRSDDAFGQLVARHMDMVYATCLRQLRDRHLAEDAAQAVFIMLAKKAKSLSSQLSVSGWLFHVARFTALNVMKSEQRRKRREQQAAAQRPVAQEDIASSELPMLLDDAMANLSPRDRDVLVMHYLQGRTYDEIGRELALAKSAVAKRVGRALARLSPMLRRRGIAVPAAAVPVALASMAQPAPAGLTQAATGVAVSASQGAVLMGGVAASAHAASHFLSIGSVVAATKMAALCLIALLTLGTATWVAAPLLRVNQPAAQPAAAPLPPLSAVPDGQLAVRVTDPAGQVVTIDDILSIQGWLDDLRAWELGLKPRILGRFADGWVLINRNQVAWSGQRADLKFRTTTGMAMLATLPLPMEERARVEFKSLASGADATVDFADQAVQVGTDEVAGRVVDAAGAPIAGAKVWFPSPVPVREFQPPPVTTATDGIFRIPPQARQYSRFMQVAKDGYATRFIVDAPVGNAFAVRMNNRTRLRGQLRLLDGVPASGAKMTLLTTRPTMRQGYSDVDGLRIVHQADVQGRYDVLVEPGEYEVQITAGGQFARHYHVLVADGQIATVPENLGAGVKLRLCAIDAVTRQLISGVRLYMEDPAWDAIQPLHDSQRTTDEHGFAEWANFMPGRWFVVPQRNGYAQWACDENEFGKEPGIDRLLLRLRRDMAELEVAMFPAMKITGEVLGGGKPEANVWVGLEMRIDSRYDQKTDAEGRFTLYLPAAPSQDQLVDKKGVAIVARRSRGGEEILAATTRFALQVGGERAVTLTFGQDQRDQEDEVVDQRAKRLEGLCNLLILYANSNRGRLPPSLGEAVVDVDSSVSREWSMGIVTTKQPPGKLNDAELIGWVNQNGDYRYVAAGKTIGDATLILAHERQPDAEGRVYVLFADRRVQRMDHKQVPP